MKVELELTGTESASIIQNLWPLYRHEVSAFDGALPNSRGLIFESDGLETLKEQGETLAEWWRRPDALFPYLIRVDGRPVGFNLISSPPYLPDGVHVDFAVHEFFLVHAYRGRGVAEKAAALGFQQHRGKWEIVTYPTHGRAIAFWRRVLRSTTGGSFTESEGEHPWGRKVIFRFENGLQRSNP